MRCAQRQVGHVSAEWLIATAALLIALFVPVDGDQSAVAMFVQAAKDYYANSMYSLSLP